MKFFFVFSNLSSDVVVQTSLDVNITLASPVTVVSNNDSKCY